MPVAEIVLKFKVDIHGQFFLVALDKSSFDTLKGISYQRRKYREGFAFYEVEDWYECWTNNRIAMAALAGTLWGGIDALTHGATPQWSPDGKAVWNTMFWPVVLFGLARFTRVLKR